ncbi:MAG: holo-ACP synthase [Armatimonadota bacterium]
MIIGIGTDIIEVGRIERAMKRSPRFCARVFTPAELEYCISCNTPAQRFAGRFAAKEAVAKCLGGSLSWLDVEILSDDNGGPVVRLSNRASSLANGRKVMVSISHCRAYAVACAIAVADDGPV